MFLRCKVRRKDGKQHRSWSVVENTRTARGRLVQRHVLYLGEINGTQELAWRRSIEVLEEGATQPRTQDVHWADATSLEVLDLTIERVRALPVLVLITFRPEYEAPWTGISHVTSIALARLAPAEVETLAEHVAGRPLPPEVTAQIVAKTDGVPLFVEELPKAVLEGGLLVAGPRGWHLDGPLPPFAIPATLQDSLAARLDRLAPGQGIAPDGAASGREISLPR